MYSFPLNILQSYALLKSYFQKYLRSRRQHSRRSPGMNGLNDCVKSSIVDITHHGPLDPTAQGSEIHKVCLKVDLYLINPLMLKSFSRICRLDQLHFC